MITKYFEDFGKIINDIDYALNSNIQFRRLNDFFGIIEEKITFGYGVLDILEVITLMDNHLNKRKYKYQFRGASDEIIFRYDNAPHHQEVATYPHHIHIKSEIKESIEPDTVQILAKIKRFLQKNND
jgi:hypothetical protein